MERGAAPAGRPRKPALGRLRATSRAALGPLCEVLAGRVRRQCRAPEARPGAEARFWPREMPRWSAERRAGQRHWPVVPGDPGIGPTARRATGCGVPHQRLPALRLPSFRRGTEKRERATPTPFKKSKPPGSGALATQFPSPEGRGSGVGRRHESRPHRPDSRPPPPRPSPQGGGRRGYAVFKCASRRL